MSPNRPSKSTSGSEARKGTRKSASAASAGNRGAREELRRERDEVVESRRIRRAVRHEFEEAQSRGLGVEEGLRRADVHTSESPILSGGDIDADWKRADVGEETVGGTVSTPDQDVVDELGEAAGVEFADNEPLDPEEKILRRDRERWELNPASSEGFREYQQERDEELEPPSRASRPRTRAAAEKTGTAPVRGTQAKSSAQSRPPAARAPQSKPAAGRTPQSKSPAARAAQSKPAGAKTAQSKPAAAKGAKGKPAPSKPGAAKRTQAPGRGKQR